MGWLYSPSHALLHSTIVWANDGVPDLTEVQLPRETLPKQRVCSGTFGSVSSCSFSYTSVSCFDGMAAMIRSVSVLGLEVESF